ncbi:MAG: hypothetical protein EXR83_05515 [Gammaproteobacteria bacterium]|nr:hypothetical protein [Gammaproteobacteria bacterium]
MSSQIRRAATSRPKTSNAGRTAPKRASAGALNTLFRGRHRCGAGTFSAFASALALIPSGSRHITHPAVSTERVSLTAQGNIRYRLKTRYRDGTIDLAQNFF